MKKMSTSKKLLILSLIIFILAIGFVGTASIFAEPSLEDLINSRVYGTYTPNFWYDDGNTSTDDWTVTGVIKSTDIVVDYSIWTDYNDDGLVNMLDVYSQEGYQFKFLVNEFSLPVLRIHPHADYYIVKMSELDQIDQVVAAVELANNNDNAEMKSQKDYYFDKDTNILYLGANLVNEMENGRELRIQTTSIVHNIDNFTKEFAIITGFSEDISNNPLRERVPYGVFRRSVKDWLTSGLTINLVQPEHLAYVSTSDLQVFVNEQETADFRYDETTGVLSFPNQSPYEINNIIVYFKSLKNVSKYDASLQYAQYIFGNETAQAIGWENMMANRICRHVAFSEEPKIGAHEPLDFYAFVYDDIPSATSGDYTIEFDNMNVANLTIFDHEKVSGSVSESDIKRAIASAYDTSTINVDTTKGVTDQMNDVLTLWRPYKNGQDEVNNLFKALGDMTTNYMVSNSTQQQVYLQAVVNALNPLGVGENAQLLDRWQYWDNNVQAVNQCVGMYIVGHTNGTTNLLGGTVTSGWPYFTVGCCQINVANSYNPEPTITKSDTHQTSISIINKDANYLYVCISPVSLGDSSTLAYQRLCGFTKIAYTYTGTGSASFSKIDERGTLLGGADYELHIATKSGSSYTYIDSQYAGFPKDITSSDIKPIVVTDLPYITGDTWYVIVEKTPPVGFMRDTKQYSFKIDSTHINQSIIATDTRQYATFILQVFDATTEGFSVPHPVQGLKFNMYDESGNIACQYNSKGEIITTYSNLITDANGRITVRVYPGTYYFRQLETVENYWLDYYADRKEENCNHILAEMPADRSGQELRFGTTHYEKRQTATIVTQVQDVSMQEKTPAILGGDGEGYVETINGQWELHVSGTDYITVGYRDNGTAVRISKDDGALEILNEGFTQAGTSFNKNGQAYLSASQIKVEGTTYPIPNGNYYWKLKSAPKGYVSNSAVSNVIDASWKVENNQIDVLTLNSDVAPLTRQTMSLNSYAKGYDKTNLAAAYSYDIAKYKSYTYKDNQGFVATENTIELKSNSKNVSNTSKEQANCNYEGTTFTVEAGVVVPDTIYQLQNQKAIVSMNGGIITPNTILGRYISDDKGHLTPINGNSNVITTFGSASIDNPNDTSKDYISSFGAISVVDNKGQGVNGTNLPNGEYVLSVIMPADEYEIETIFENTPFTAAWDSSKSNIDVNVTTLLYHAKNTVDDKGIVNVGMFLAASPIANNPADPYDPQHPDAGSVDDSDDIPTTTVDWIIAHTNDKAYRTVDDANVTLSDSGIKTYDTQDTVPTTFATTFKDSTESKWNTTYELYFYYEISKATYDAATNKDKWNYREQEINGETHYFQRFAVPGSSSNGNLLLEDFIVFNKAAQDSAYDNGVTTIKRNLPLSGAVYNTMWLNSQMVDPSFNGTYYIAAGVLITREKVNEVSGINMRKQEFTDDLALLTVKSRQLFTLD